MYWPWVTGAWQGVCVVVTRGQLGVMMVTMGKSLVTSGSLITPLAPLSTDNYLANASGHNKQSHRHAAPQAPLADLSLDIITGPRGNRPTHLGSQETH